MKKILILLLIPLILNGCSTVLNSGGQAVFSYNYLIESLPELTKIKEKYNDKLTQDEKDTIDLGFKMTLDLETSLKEYYHYRDESSAMDLIERYHDLAVFYPYLREDIQKMIDRGVFKNVDLHLIREVDNQALLLDASLGSLLLEPDESKRYVKAKTIKQSIEVMKIVITLFKALK